MIRTVSYVARPLPILNDYGELRAKQIAETASRAFLHPGDNWQVIPFPVQLPRPLEDTGGAKFYTDIAPFAEIPVDLYDLKACLAPPDRTHLISSTAIRLSISDRSIIESSMISNPFFHSLRAAAGRQYQPVSPRIERCIGSEKENGDHSMAQ